VDAHPTEAIISALHNCSTGSIFLGGGIGGLPGQGVELITGPA
jgi:hypothetical protein